MIPTWPKTSTSAAFVLSIACSLVSTQAVAQGVHAPIPSLLEDYASGTARLEIDPSADAIFLSMIFRGGRLGIQEVYSFFGDGMVRFEKFRGYATSTPFESASVQIDAVEKERVLEQILSGRLMAADPAAIASKAMERGEILLQAQDDEVVVVTLSLIARQGDRGSPATVRHEFLIDALAIQRPFAEEWEALARIASFAAEVRDWATTEEGQ